MTPPRGTALRAVQDAATRETWDDEYADRAAIPSSHRDAPSTALVELRDALELSEDDVVLDVGCGNGRNAVALATLVQQVIAIDFSTEALALVRERIRESPVADSIALMRGDVRHGLPFPPDAVDVVVDSYVSCHFLDPETFDAYLDDVARVLGRTGRLYWSALSAEDEYYRGLADTHPDENVVVDPLNDVAKRLFTADEVTAGFTDRLHPVDVAEVSFVDTVDGEEYHREILAAVYRVTEEV